MTDLALVIEAAGDSAFQALVEDGLPTTREGYRAALRAAAWGGAVAVLRASSRPTHISEILPDVLAAMSRDPKAGEGER